MRLPGVRIGSDPADLFRQPAGGHVRERDVLQHGAQVAAHRDPDIPQGLGDPGVLDLLGPLAAHVRDRALDGADHVCQRDLGRVLCQPVAAFGAALALYEAGVLQVEQDVLEELQRDLLGRGDVVAFDRPLACNSRELGARANGVVDLGGDSHAGEI